MAAKWRWAWSMRRELRTLTFGNYVRPGLERVAGHTGRPHGLAARSRDELGRRRATARALAGPAAAEGRPASRRRAARGGAGRRRAHRLQPRRPPARRRVERAGGAARDRRRRRRSRAGADRRRHPARRGRRQGDRARRARRADRATAAVGTRGRRRSRRRARARRSTAPRSIGSWACSARATSMRCAGSICWCRMPYRPTTEG